MLIAQGLSMVLTPFYLPIVGLTVLFFFTYMNLLPWQFKVHVLLITYFFTILLPTLLIRLYRHYHGWTLFELGAREKRFVPYSISIICYLICYYLMNRMRVPHFMSGIIVAALMVQMMCIIINAWWKISMHMTAIGGVTGCLVIYSAILGFNPLWWLCLLFIISGLLGTARMMLQQHTLSQVIWGYLLGIIVSGITIIYL